MPGYRGSVISMVKHPSGWVPLALSLFAVLMLIAYVALFGVVQSQDEGPAARLYQLIMLADLMFVGWFVMRWPTRDLKAGATVFALQLLAIAASLVPLLMIEG